MDPQLQRFYRQYMQQIQDPILPPGELLKQEDVQRSLEQRFFNEENARKFSPSYQAKVLDRVIALVEAAVKNPEDEGVSDHLYTYRANLCQAEQTDIYKKRTLTYTPPTDFDSPATSIVIEEAQYLLGSASNVGLRTWEASLRLAHFLWNHQALIRGRHVLELGAGTGFLSAFCSAVLSAKHVLATDGNDQVLESLRHNVDLNRPFYGPRVPPVVKKLSWEDVEDFDSVITSEDGAGFKPDIVIGADITYHPDACKALASLLAKLARFNPACEFLIAVTVREVKTLESFVQRCESDEFGLKVKEVEFRCPDIHEQKGLFHTVAMPIRIYAIRTA